MPQANETIIYPYTSFNFSVEINVDLISPKLCSASFQDCDGLDMNMDVKTIREGGNNRSQIRLIGPLTYGQITLKRGMTASFDLWDWFDMLQDATAQQLRTVFRSNAQIVLFAADRTTERARWTLTRCLPVKLKAPALNAKDGVVAIEELQIVYESLALSRPQ